MGKSIKIRVALIITDFLLLYPQHSNLRLLEKITFVYSMDAHVQRECKIVSLCESRFYKNDRTEKAVIDLSRQNQAVVFCHALNAFSFMALNDFSN